MKPRRPKRLRPSPGEQLLAAMSALQRRAHRLLAEELSVTDAALADWVARAMAAAKILHGRATDGQGQLHSCFKPSDPATPPILMVHREPLADVVDLTAYRLERAARGRAVR